MKAGLFSVTVLATLAAAQSPSSSGGSAPSAGYDSSASSSYPSASGGAASSSSLSSMSTMGSSSAGSSSYGSSSAGSPNTGSYTVGASSVGASSAGASSMSSSNMSSMSAGPIGSNSSVVYTTVISYTDICTTAGYTSTTTGVTTQTYCDKCPGMQAPAPGLWTTYTTVYSAVCPTGSTLTPVTYAVTEPCPYESTGLPLPANYVPSGFTTTVAQCNCEHGSATLTVPQATGSTPTPTGPAAVATTPAAAIATVPGAYAAGNSSAGCPGGDSCNHPAPATSIQPGAGARPVVSLAVAVFGALSVAIYFL